MSDLHTPAPWYLDDADRHSTSLIEEGYHFIDAGAGFYKPDHARGFHLSGWMSKADAHLITAAPVLLDQLKHARQMLANYAAFDERHGLNDDAAFTRRRLVEIDAAIASASPEIAPTAKSEPSNVVQIGDHDPEYKRNLDTVAEIVGAPQFDGAAS
jgi:hypothetical protein